MSAANQLALSARVSTRRISARVASRAARQTPGYVALAGVCAILTSASGSLAIGAPLAGAAAITTSASAALTVGKDLAGTSAITTSASATLTALAALSGTAAIATGASAAISLTRNLVGSSAVTTGASATLSVEGQVSLAGTSAITTGASATATVAKPLAGTSAIATGASAALTLTYNLAGTAAVTSGASGDTFLITNNLAGTSSITTGASATLSVEGQISLAGTSAITTGASATATVAKDLAGTSAIATGASATLSVSGGGGGSAPAFLGAYSVAANTGVNSLTIPSVVVSGSDKIIIVAIDSWKASGPGVVSVVFSNGGGESFTRSAALSRTWEGGSGIHEVWYLINPTSTTASITVTFQTGTDSCAAACVVLTGVNQSTPFGTGSSTDATGTSISVSPASATTDLVVTTLAYYEATTYTPGTGVTVPSGGTSEASGTEAVKIGYKAGEASSTTTAFTAGATSEMSLISFAVHGV